MSGFFGTDGVRGAVGRAPMTPDFLVHLGFAAGNILLSRRADGTVLIGKDTRISGYMVESALEAGFSAAGVNVLLSGPLPTSAVSYLTQTLRLDVGVVISASHNPHGDNGVKFFAADGCKLPKQTETAIEQFLRDKEGITFDGNPGRARRLEDAAGRYIEFCKRAFPPQMSLRGMKVAVDCANGSAYHVAPPVFHELGADVVALGDRPDGLNINVDCGVLAPAAAIEAVLRQGADIGVLLDGDGDRVHLVDGAGRLWDGDAVVLLIANFLRRRGTAVDGVAGTVLSNMALELEMKRLGIGFERTAVGDRHIAEELRRRGWILGGEPSGHILLRHLHNTGDGIISALQVLAAMRERECTLSDLLGDFAPFPQARRNVAVDDGRGVSMDKKIADCLAQARQTLGEEGRVVVRASGTEPLYRIMVEGRDQAQVGRIADDIAAAMTRS